MDPLAENHYDSSPYAYALNNPSTYIDLLGLDTLNNNNNFNCDEWGKFNTEKDHIKLDEVTVNGYRNNWSWGLVWNNISNSLSYPGLGWSMGGPPSGIYGPYMPTDKDINSAGAVLSMIPATAPLGVVMQLSTAKSKGDVGLILATSLPYMRIVKGFGTAAKGVSKFGDYNLARNTALGWLTERGFKAEKAVMGKFGTSKGKPIGMSSMDGHIGFRVEYDARSGAHINVWFGKEKGPHFQFEASEETVNEIIKRFSR